MSLYSQLSVQNARVLRVVGFVFDATALLEDTNNMTMILLYYCTTVFVSRFL